MWKRLTIKIKIDNKVTNKNSKRCLQAQLYTECILGLNFILYDHDKLIRLTEAKEGLKVINYNWPLGTILYINYTCVYIF